MATTRKKKEKPYVSPLKKKWLLSGSTIPTRTAPQLWYRLTISTEDRKFVTEVVGWTGEECTDIANHIIELHNDCLK